MNAISCWRPARNSLVMFLLRSSIYESALVSEKIRIPSRTSRDPGASSATGCAWNSTLRLLAIVLFLFASATAGLLPLFLVFGRHGLPLFAVELSILVLIVLVDQFLASRLLFLPLLFTICSAGRQNHREGQSY